MSTLAERLSALNSASRWEESAALARDNQAEVLADPKAAWNAGWALFRLERFEDALGHFARADEADPTSPIGSWARGLTLRELGRIDEAERHLRRSIQCRSSHLNRAPLALLYLETDRLEEAERCHLEGLAERRSRERLEHYADFLGDTGRVDEENAILREAADAPFESRRMRHLSGEPRPAPPFPFVELSVSIADELRRALHDLAQPAEVQRSILPDWVVIGDELALAFRQALQRMRAAGVTFEVDQARALDELDAYMTDLSGPRDKAFWSNPDSLRRDSRWQNVRDMAKAALDAISQQTK